MAIGIVGDAGVRAVGQQEKLFVGMILILIFAEALGLYGKCKIVVGVCIVPFFVVLVSNMFVPPYHINIQCQV